MQLFKEELLLSTLSSLDQQGHCRIKVEYSMFLMQSNLISCMPFCFAAVYKSLRAVVLYYTHQNIIIYCRPLLTVMLINCLILLLYSMLSEDREDSCHSLKTLLLFVFTNTHFTSASNILDKRRIY